MKVVANTTPIIYLASIGRLDLLERLFGRVLIAEAVYRELKAKPSYGYAQVDCLFKARFTISAPTVLHRIETTPDFGPISG